MSLLSAQRLLRPPTHSHLYGNEGYGGGGASERQISESQFSSQRSSQDGSVSRFSHSGRPPRSRSNDDARALAAVTKRVADHESALADQSWTIKRLEQKLDASLEAQATLRDQLIEQRGAISELRSMPEMMCSLVAGLRQQISDGQAAQEESTRSLINAEFGRVRASFMLNESQASASQRSLLATSTSQRSLGLPPSSSQRAFLAPSASPPSERVQLMSGASPMPPEHSAAKSGGGRSNATVGRKRRLHAGYDNDEPQVLYRVRRSNPSRLPCPYLLIAHPCPCLPISDTVRV